MTPAHHRTPLSSHAGAIGELREHNLALIMWELIAKGRLSRHELGASTGLSPAALSKLVAELRERHLAAEHYGTSTGTGRRGAELSLSTQRWALAAAVLGPAELYVVVSALDGKPLAQQRVGVSDPSDVSGYLEALCTALRGATVALHRLGLELLALEVSVTGGVNRNAGRVVFSPTLGWTDVDILTRVRAMLRERPTGVARNVSVHVDSDVNHAMVARLERPGRRSHVDLWAQGPDAAPRLTQRQDAPAPEPAAMRWGRNPSVVYLGGPLTVGGSLYHGAVERGSDGLAGQYGHIIVSPGGPLCWCGRRGCLEACIGIAALHAKACGGVPAGEPLPAHTPALLEELVDDVRQSRSRATAVVYEAGRILGGAIDTLGVILNPHSVLVDGYLARLGEPLRRGVIDHLREVWTASEVYYPSVSFVDEVDDPSARGALLMAAQVIAARPNLALV